jgi:hypothetical protein
VDLFRYIDANYADSDYVEDITEISYSPGPSYEEGQEDYFEAGYIDAEYFQNPNSYFEEGYIDEDYLRAPLTNGYYEEGYIDEAYFERIVSASSSSLAYFNISAVGEIVEPTGEVKEFSADWVAEFTSNVSVDKFVDFAGDLVSEFVQVTAVDKTSDVGSTMNAETEVFAIISHIEGADIIANGFASLSADADKISGFGIDIDAEFIIGHREDLAIFPSVKPNAIFDNQSDQLAQATMTAALTRVQFGQSAMLAQSRLVASALRPGTIIFEPVSGLVEIDTTVFSPNVGFTGIANSGSLKLRNTGSVAVLRSTVSTSSIEQWAIPNPNLVDFSFPTNWEFGQYTIAFDIKHSTQTQSPGIIFRAGTTGTYSSGGTTPYWILSNTWITNDGIYRQFKLSINDGTTTGSDTEYIFVGSNTLDWTEWHNIRIQTNFSGSSPSSSLRRISMFVNNVQVGGNVDARNGTNPLSTTTYQRMEFRNSTTSDIWFDNWRYSRSLPVQTYPSGYNWNSITIPFDSSFNRVETLTQTGQAVLQSTSTVSAVLNGIAKANAALTSTSALTCQAQRQGEIALLAFSDAALTVTVDKVKDGASDLVVETAMVTDNDRIRYGTADTVVDTELDIQPDIIREFDAAFSAFVTKLTLADKSTDVVVNIDVDSVFAINEQRIRFGISDLFAETDMDVEVSRVRQVLSDQTSITDISINAEKTVDIELDLQALFGQSTMTIKTADIICSMFNAVSMQTVGNKDSDAVVAMVDDSSTLVVDAAKIVGIEQDLAVLSEMTVIPFFTVNIEAALLVEGFVLSTGAIYHINEQVYKIPRENRNQTILAENRTAKIRR